MTQYHRISASEGDTVPSDHHRSTVEKIKNLPAPVGVVLMGIGIVGLVLPGPIGTPFLLAGGLVLAPKVFGGLDHFVQRRFPEFHQVGMESVDRFLADLEKRYPDDRGNNE